MSLSESARPTCLRINYLTLKGAYQFIGFEALEAITPIRRASSPSSLLCTRPTCLPIASSTERCRAVSASMHEGWPKNAT